MVVMMVMGIYTIYNICNILCTGSSQQCALQHHLLTAGLDQIIGWMGINGDKFTAGVQGEPDEALFEEVLC